MSSFESFWLVIVFSHATTFTPSPTASVTRPPTSESSLSMPSPSRGSDGNRTDESVASRPALRYGYAPVATNARGHRRCAGRRRSVRRRSDDQRAATARGDDPRQGSGAVLSERHDGQPGRRP